MTKKQFDEFFRQRLHPLESPVPDRLFEGIMQRRKKRRMLVWWVYGTAAIVLGLCLITAGSYWSLVRSKTSEPIAQTQTAMVTPNVVADHLLSNNSLDVVKESKIDKIINKKINKNKENKKEKVEKKDARKFKNANVLTTTTQNTDILNTSNSNSNVLTTTTQNTDILNTSNSNILNTTTTQNIDILNTNTSNANDNFVYQLQGPECFVFGKQTQARDFYLEAYGAWNINQRTLKNRTTDFGTKYLDKRNETEKSMYGLGLGLRAVLLVNQQLAVKAGVTYAEILERFEYIDKEYEIIERDPLTGIVTAIQKGTSKQKSYNRYHSVDIPFMVGYELHSDKIGFGLDLGAAFNVGAWQKGDMFNTEDKIVSFGKNANDTKYPIIAPFQTIIGASVLADLSFYYRLNQKSQLFVQPHFRYYLNSFTKTDYPLEQRYLTGGLQLGVRKKF